MAPVVTSSASIMSVSTELSGAALVNTLIVGAWVYGPVIVSAAGAASTEEGLFLNSFQAQLSL